MKMRMEKTKTGKAAAWESGGGWTNTGKAVIIASSKGVAMKPIFIRRRGHLACGEHALLPVTKGTLIVFCYKLGRAELHDYEAQLYRVEKLIPKEGEYEAELTLLWKGTKDCGQDWNPVPPEIARAALTAAERKTRIYHCRVPVFVK